MSDENTTNGTTGQAGLDAEVVVIGAGMAGLYLLHRLRGLNVSTIVLESADGVGGTWYWNRYPGARCDITSLNYSYSFDAQLEQEWEWSEKYATQPEILEYLNHVADRFDLRRDIRFGTALDTARWDEETHTWTLTTDAGDTITCRWYVMATGCLSIPKDVDIEGADRFAGPTYSTGRWPHEGVDFTGQRVAVIGTGSSAIQSIPLIAEEASELVVFQRTPNFSLPAKNRPLDPDEVAAVKARYPEFREEARWTRGGVTLPIPTESAHSVDHDERIRRFNEAYETGHLLMLGTTFMDLGVNAEANEFLCEFMRDKVREKVDDSEVAEMLCARHFPIFTKRMCLDTNYYETFNLPHVSLVDLRAEPIAAITETGIDTTDRSFTFDAIVFATGFDAMTGAIVGVDVEGIDGLSLREAWTDGPRTYLGLTVPGFPNFFTITGPQSPSVLSNMAVSIEQHVEWVSDSIAHLRDRNVTSIDATQTAADGWVQHSADWGDITLFSQADSWYMGANVPGKPRVLLPYLGGVGPYRQACLDVVERDWLGFRLSGPDGEQCNDGIIRSMQPDVELMLEVMAGMGLPSLDSLDPPAAREMMGASAAVRPPGPDVGEIIDGTYPGADGDLAYRLYRPDSDGPHPVIAYFHGGGWVLGDAQSDDPLCRYLCAETGAIVVSFDYRHAPEAPFPAAPDDAWAAVSWVAENAAGLGGTDRLVVAGWSAGANLAAVTCQRARDEGGPAIAGQMLITPVVDADFSRGSYEENAEGKVLTTSLMTWFWDHYCPADQRNDPRASPINGNLADLPPTVVATADFDPLRDEGIAYVDAIVAAGGDATHHRMRGQIHTSIGGVGVLASSDSDRAEVAAALRGMLGAAV